MDINKITNDISVQIGNSIEMNFREYLEDVVDMFNGDDGFKWEDADYFEIEITGITSVSDAVIHQMFIYSVVKGNRNNLGEYYYYTTIKNNLLNKIEELGHNKKEILALATDYMLDRLDVNFNKENKVFVYGRETRKDFIEIQKEFNSNAKEIIQLLYVQVPNMSNEDKDIYYAKFDDVNIMQDTQSHKIMLSINIEYYNKDSESITGYKMYKKLPYVTPLYENVYPLLTKENINNLKNAYVSIVDKVTSTRKEQRIMSSTVRIIKSSDTNAWITGGDTVPNKDKVYEKLTRLVKSEDFKSSVLGIVVNIPNTYTIKFKVEDVGIETLTIGAGGIINSRGEILYANKSKLKAMEGKNTVKDCTRMLLQVLGNKNSLISVDIANCYDLRKK